MKCNIYNKVNFIEDLNRVIPKYQTNITLIEYIVYKQKQSTNWYQEFLVVNYTGGARSIRNCNGNSFSAIFEELSKLLDSGYYDEERLLNDFKNDPNWERVL